MEAQVHGAGEVAALYAQGMSHGLTHVTRTAHLDRLNLVEAAQQGAVSRRDLLQSTSLDRDAAEGGQLPLVG
eukprot:CAMPEP_0119092486 /NCGR_PEP_ID=MMETSP1178-20130426/159997_1 /TAXON_ID=33656 /ORGANISM="unid sp, Strain CCMP2000" /LENGTH=71 /DNA_ID=CAMNT_0007076069 /DNA_START=231 /DNA_END=442 /DNA_ORIENTATION=+